ncbi:hypothetical protein J7J90_04215 [Candidatus Micrarchaeota archaeon]|nr:hypothetical protein [Candidatus Micrarchaeota archaeon]
MNSKLKNKTDNLEKPQFRELGIPLLDNTELPKLKSDIISSVQDVGKGVYQIREVQKYTPNSNYKHELLFFIKPEVTDPDNHVDLSSVLDIIFNIFKEYSIFVEGIYTIGASYLKKYNLIANHYSVINRVAKEGIEALSNDALKMFNEVYNIDSKNPGDNVEILGGFQFLQKYKNFDPKSLELLWSNTGFKKIASGVFATKLKLFNKEIYLLNGFFPFRLEHYTSKGKSIVVMIISSNVGWDTLRNKMLGITDPQKAYDGSIRRILFEYKDRWSLKNVNTGYNCVHMSAGPIEALSEIVRFLSRYDNNVIIKPDETMIGKRFIDGGFSNDDLDYFMSNPKVLYKGRVTNIFDLTEENNIEEVISKLKEIKVISYSNY